MHWMDDEYSALDSALNAVIVEILADRKMMVLVDLVMAFVVVACQWAVLNDQVVYLDVAYDEDHHVDDQTQDCDLHRKKKNDQN